MNNLPQLTWGKRLWALVFGIGIALLLPVEALVMGVFAWAVFHQSVEAFQDTFWAFFVLGVLALSIERCTNRTLLKQALVERDAALAQTAQTRPAASSRS